MRFLPFSIPLHLTVNSALQRGFLCRKVRVGWTSGQEKKIHTAIDFDRYLFARRVIITFDRYLHKMTLSKLLDRVFLAIYKSRTLLVVKPARLRFFSTRMLEESKNNWRASKRIICFTTKHIFELGKNDFECSGHPLVAACSGWPREGKSKKND